MLSDDCTITYTKVSPGESFFKVADRYYTGYRVHKAGYCWSETKGESCITFWGWLARLCMIGIPTSLFHFIAN